MEFEKSIGFVNLDSRSLKLASALTKSGYFVKAYQGNESWVMQRFLELGGSKCNSPMEAVKDSSAIILLDSEDDLTDVLFESSGFVTGLHKDAIVILNSASSTSHISSLEKCLSENINIPFVDMRVFEGFSEDSNVTDIVVVSGKHDAVQKAQPVFSALCAKVYIFEGEVDVGSKIKMINDLLEGIHLVASVEAIFLGVRFGIHPAILFDIISNAAGSSRVFVDITPKILVGDQKLTSIVDTMAKNVASVLGLAKSLPFPLPLLAMGYQQLIYSSSCNKHGDDMPASPLKVWEQTFNINIREAAKMEAYDPENLACQLSLSSSVVKRIGFIGLGAMGFGMASHLLKSGFEVVAYDVYKPTLSRFIDLGGRVGNSPGEVSKDAEVLIIMVASELQAESVLYGDSGSVSNLPAGSTIILSSTVSPGFIIRLKQRLLGEQKVFKLVDAPVSGGVIKAADGTLTIMASGTDEALRHTSSVLTSLSEKLYIIKGGCGAASSVKTVNQLLAGVHIAAAAEAMALGARLGINTKKLFDIISQMRGYSWMFGNRVPHMINNDYTPYSAIDIFVKDLGIVCSEGSHLDIPLHISSAAHQLFISGSASGWGRYDDAAIVKVYEKQAGVNVEAKSSIVKEDVLKSLPPEWPEDPIETIRSLTSQSSKTLVVLDDDPTGTQTVHDIEVLTEWDVETLEEQFRKKQSCFFILTNSRSLSTEKAVLLTKEICTNLDTAAKAINGTDFTVILRGDSTLRGHFPEEADATVSILGEMDAWVICPFFLQGGRYTINDVHYVADSDRLVPAGETEFSKDAAFGYTSSNLKEWIEEKTKGKVQARNIASVSIQLLRSGGPAAVCDYLCSLSKGSICIVNAASERDMAVFAAGMIKAEMMGKKYLCRTAASFVSTRIGIIPKPPMFPKDIGIGKHTNGGLIIVGSYVPKTTKQVEELKSKLGDVLNWVEVSVDKLSMKSLEERNEEINNAAEIANASIKANKDTVLITSRQLITGKSRSESLEINFKVSSALVEIVRNISARPRYILAKGGITSSDIATKALEARRAMVIGQALAGVPLWRLGPESRLPSVPYIVFPGNVGNNDAVADVVKNWACPLRTSTKDMLLTAEKRGYAIGAFNVYNLEGVEAVVAAAEEENSPAILQIHPGAMKKGGITLVACCISAAQHAKVPIAVHFDHGNSKSELVEALELGFDSVMVDGSHLSFEENITYTKHISTLAHKKGMLVEAELGRLSGTEDDLTVEEYEAKLTDVSQAKIFMEQTSIDALAVCIGNVHGKYPASGPNLKLDLLKELDVLTRNYGVSLVLHGASGLSSDLIKECIKLGVRKFNVNTEVRNAYLESLRTPKNDLIQVMEAAKQAMKAVVAEKMNLFGSAGKA